MATFTGGPGNDTFVGGSDADSISGLGGSDTLSGGGNNDTIFGGDDDDLLGGDDGNDSIFGGSGNDTIDGNNNDDVIFGGIGNDSIDGGSGDDTIAGGVGDDTMDGEGGTDTVAYDGATANLVINLATGTATGDGIDSLNRFENAIGGSGADSITGTTGANVLTGGGGNDTLDGGNGNDTLNGGAGDDSLIGGAGTDTADYTGTAGAVTVNLTLGSNQATGGAGTDQLSLIENVTGGTGNDTITGSTGNNVLSGGDGTDSIFGGDGNDNLFGGIGNDSLFGGNGNDTMAGGVGADFFNGGTGLDILDYSASGAAVTVTLEPGQSVASGGDAAGDTFTGMDGIIGSAFNDSLTGFDGESTNPADAFTNILFGGAGNDTIDGKAGSDSLFGGADNDSILGGAGNDSIGGDDGNDTLFGGTGGDTLAGGEGNDVIDGGEGPDSLFGGEGEDTLFGGIGDVIDGGGGVDVLDLSPYGKDNVQIIASGPTSGTVNIFANGVLQGSFTFENIGQVIPCFTPGALITTARGPLPVEEVTPDTRVLTRDNGFQVVRWAGRRDLTAAELARQPAFAPVHIARGAMGNGLPLRDLVVSPQHRMLVSGRNAEVCFGEHEVLVAALHLVGQPGITRLTGAPVSYLHILFDRHEIVQAEAAWTESFQPGAGSMQGMDGAVRHELLALFPELADGGLFPAARLTLKAHEARVLAAA